MTVTEQMVGVQTATGGQQLTATELHRSAAASSSPPQARGSVPTQDCPPLQETLPGCPLPQLALLHGLISWSSHGPLPRSPTSTSRAKPSHLLSKEKPSNLRLPWLAAPALATPSPPCPSDSQGPKLGHVVETGHRDSGDVVVVKGPERDRWVYRRHVCSYRGSYARHGILPRGDQPCLEVEVEGQPRAERVTALLSYNGL